MAWRNHPDSPLWFYSWCLFISPVLPRAFVLRYPLKLSIMPSARRQLLPSPSLVWSQTCVSSPTRGRRLICRDSLLTPFSGLGAVDRATWELIRGLGYSGSSLSYWLSLSSATSFIGRIFPVCIHEVGMALVQFGRSALTDYLKVLRPENSAGRILVRNHLHSPYPHKDDVLPRASLHGTC